MGDLLIEIQTPKVIRSSLLPKLDPIPLHWDSQDCIAQREGEVEKLELSERNAFLLYAYQAILSPHEIIILVITT